MYEDLKRDIKRYFVQLRQTESRYNSRYLLTAEFCEDEDFTKHYMIIVQQVYYGSYDIRMEVSVLYKHVRFGKNEWIVTGFNIVSKFNQIVIDDGNMYVKVTPSKSNIEPSLCCLLKYDLNGLTTYTIY